MPEHVPGSIKITYILTECSCPTQ